MCLSCCAIGCLKEKPVYLSREYEIIELKKGDVSPHDGFLISPGYMAEIYEALDGE